MKIAFIEHGKAAGILLGCFNQQPLVGNIVRHNTQVTLPGNRLYFCFLLLASIS